MILIWIGFIIGGFLLGSILFSKIIPKITVGKNICELGSDGNPGAANVFMKCGKGLERSASLQICSKDFYLRS